MPALGISDLMNEFGLVKFYKACRGAGIKPIGAADVWIGNPNAPDKPFRAMLIIRNDAGYLRLSELLTEAYVGKDRNIHHAELNPELAGKRRQQRLDLFEWRALRRSGRESFERQ